MYNNGASMEETNRAADDKACLCFIEEFLVLLSADETCVVVFFPPL